MGRITLATPPTLTPALTVEPPSSPTPEPVEGSLEGDVDDEGTSEPSSSTPEAEAPDERRDTPAVARLRAAASECGKAEQAARALQRSADATCELRRAEVKVAEAAYTLAPSVAGLTALNAARATAATAEAAAERALAATTLATTAERDALRLLACELQRELRPSLTDDGLCERILPLLRRLAANERDRHAIVAELAACEVENEKARFACERILGAPVLGDADLVKRLAGAVTHAAARTAPSPARPFFYRPHEAPLGWSALRWVDAAVATGRS